MAGAAAAETILFIASVVLATAAVGALAPTMDGLAASLRDQGERMSQQLRSDVTIVNDPLNVATSPLVLYVKNTGDATLLAPLTDVLVDGTLATDVSYDVLDASDDTRWGAGQVLQITVDGLALAAGDHAVRVVSESGVEDTLRFTV